MKKYTTIYIVIFVLSVLASTLFNSFVPDFKLKSIVGALIMIIPILGYSFFYSKIKQNKSQQNKERLKEYVESINPDSASHFESVVLDYSTKNFDDNFRYMQISDHLFFEHNGEYKLIVSGQFNLKIGKKKINIDILFNYSNVYIDITGKEIKEKLDIEYPKKGIYKTLEKEICTKISEL